MAAIRVRHLESAPPKLKFEVVVEAQQSTIHLVSTSAEYVRKIGGDDIDAAALVEESFEFLLEREPNTSILRSFDLKVIQSYFPEYEKTIASRL